MDFSLAILVAVSIAAIIVLWNRRTNIIASWRSGPKVISLSDRAKLMQQARADALEHAAILEAEIANTRDDLANAMARLKINHQAFIAGPQSDLISAGEMESLIEAQR